MLTRQGWVKLFVAGVMMLGLAGVVQAEPGLQGGALTLFGEPVIVKVSAGQSAQSIAFECAPDAVLSVVAVLTTGAPSLDMTVADSDGSVLVAPTQTVRLDDRIAAEAFVPVRGGMCTVSLAQTADAAAYAVSLLGGFADLVIADGFDNAGDPQSFTWESWQGENTSGDLVDSRLQLNVTKDNFLGYHVPEDGFDWDNYYLQVDVSVVGKPSYQEHGVVFRLNSEDETFYNLSYSTDSDWSVYYFNGDWNEIQAWTVSPAVDGADTTPQIGMFVDGRTLRAYHNGMFVGQADLADWASSGTVGLAAGTLEGQTDPVTLAFDNLFVTRPLGERAAVEVPAVVNPPTDTMAGPVLDNWYSDNPQDIVVTLQTQALIPGKGQMSLTIPDSFGETSQEGFSYYRLAEGQSFHNFALGFDARLTTSGAGSGCGMHFRDNDDSSNSTQVFEDGYAMLAMWDADGMYPQSFVEVHPAVVGGVGVTNRVLVVAQDAYMALYVNGALVHEDIFNDATGQVALELYVEKDDSGGTELTRCELDNIWLWSFN